MLDSEPIIGSFTVDGLTFAVTGESSVEFVGVAPSVILSGGNVEGVASGLPDPVTLSEAAEGGEVEGSNESHASEAGVTSLTLPESVTYEGADYILASIAPYAFYLSGVTDVTLPASVSNVDERAFRSCDVERIEVNPASEAYASFDGVLYDANLSRLLLIPGGRNGALLISDKAEEVDATAFSHCAGADAISVDGEGVNFSSWEGLLYDADGTTLLRVPAGATEITIRDGCTTIAAGALEACASLKAINAPASVTSISPYLLEQEPETVIAPVAVAAVEGEDESDLADEDESGGVNPVGAQLTALVALTSTDDDLPKINPFAITVALPGGVDAACWEAVGFAVEKNLLMRAEEEDLGPIASVESASTYAANTYTMTLHATNGTINGATTWKASVTVGLGNSVTRVNIAERTGYIFKGWYTNTSGGTQIYRPDGNNSTANITNDGVYWRNNVWIYEGNATFYAQWDPIEYSMSLHLTGGTIVDSSGGTIDAAGKWTATSPPVAYNAARWDCVSVAARPGHTFKGYYTNTSGGTQIYKPDSNGQTATMVNDGTYWKDGRWVYMGNMTFYAQWTANTITLTWNSNGGSSIGNTSATYSSSAKVPMPASNPTRAGYTFAGWYTAASGGTQITSSTALPTSSTTYHAHWNANTITLTWNSNGGSSIGNTSKAYAVGATVPMPASNPTRIGYTFKGWFTSTTSTTKVTGSTALPTTNTTYYAQWTANTITLTWNSQGGSAVGNTSKVYASGAKVPMPASNPNRAGYSFKGWFTAASGGTQVTSNTALPTSNATYYAQWTANTITLTWNSNGGSSVGNTSATYSSSAKVPMPASNPTRAGYTFAGWYTAASGGTQITSSTALPTSSTTYHAHWNANTITLTWNSQGGSAVSNTSATYSPTAKVPMPATTSRSGYTFAGWWTSATGGTQVTSSTALPTANTTYYAHWSLNPYAITYDLAGGSVSGNPTTYDVTTTTFTLKNPTRTGYAFAGWSGTGLSGSANKTVTIAKGSTGNRAYTANWSANPYIVEYWDKAGTTKFSSDTGFRYDTARALAGKPSSGLSMGYTALGWARSAGQSSAAYGFGSSQSNLATSGTVALYLAERPNAYTVVFEPNGGTGGPFADIAATYDAYLELPVATRQGYVFLGWQDAATGANYQPGQIRNLASEDRAIVRLSAQWAPTVSADIPLEVTAKVDVLGIEEQEEATGYIESRCGEPLRVAAIDLAPLSGAADLFGAGNVADVALEVRAVGSTSPDASFALSASASQAPAAPAAFHMASYGARVPISYRFAIPEDVLSAIDPARFEQVTTPVCSVAYTVALAGSGS